MGMSVSSNYGDVWDISQAIGEKLNWSNVHT